MTLRDLLARSGLKAAMNGEGDAGAENPIVHGFALDSRKVESGFVFGAFAGASVNGEEYISQAIAAGAVAIVARPEVCVEGVLHIASHEPRRLFAQLAATFYTPLPQTVVAITGTNGKTSCVEMVRQLWMLLGKSSASIGTLGVTQAEGSVYTGLTSPDIVTFLSSMQDLAANGIGHVAYEASSHGLMQYRSEGLQVKAGGFTNLSHDHLDYHGSMDAYFAAKMRLFDEVIEPCGRAVIWADDPWSDKALEHAQKRGLEAILVGENGRDLRLVSRTIEAFGQKLEIEYHGQRVTVHLPLIGGYQVANALISAGLVIASGADARDVFSALEKLKPVRGRLELVGVTHAGASAYVDYAHTPDALKAAIAALRPHLDADGGRLIVVFGAGGDRDAAKRSEMGCVVAQHAEHMIVTDDNPRGEDPAEIRAMILEGVSRCAGVGEDVIAQTVQEIGLRDEAIASAMAFARSGDIVLVAGKGHEQGQIFGRGAAMRIVPFDDVEVIKEIIA